MDAQNTIVPPLEEIPEDALPKKYRKYLPSPDVIIKRYKKGFIECASSIERRRRYLIMKKGMSIPQIDWNRLYKLSLNFFSPKIFIAYGEYDWKPFGGWYIEVVVPFNYLLHGWLIPSYYSQKEIIKVVEERDIHKGAERYAKVISKFYRDWPIKLATKEKKLKELLISDTKFREFIELLREDNELKLIFLIKKETKNVLFR